MQVHLYDSAAQVGQAAAILIGAQLISKPNAVLGLATGSSPIPTYQELIRMHRAGVVDFSSAVSFNLDEYCRLPESHPCSYHDFMHQQLFAHVNFAQGNTHVPNGNAADLAAECARYDQAIAKAGGIDLQLLGIGHNGHIGFNEPTCSLASRTRVESLTESTRAANARFFDGDMAAVPTRCITQGIATIMTARHLVLLAFGPAKADAVAQLVEGPVSARWPATILQHHPHATVIVDEAAAAKLELADYYRKVYGDTPTWRAS